VKFEVNLSGAPEEVTQLMNNIQEVAEMFLYRWKTFPIVLPPPACSTLAAYHSPEPINYADGVNPGRYIPISIDSILL